VERAPETRASIRKPWASASTARTSTTSCPRTTIAIWPIENRTTQHLDDQLLTVLSSIETSLVQSGDVRVIARSSQDALADEIYRGRSAMFDPATAQRAGKQLGAQYFVTGRITSVDEKMKKMRRLQYSLFMQVLEVETGQLMWQNEVTRSKALKR
jgi:TolB-like protein